MAFQYEVLRYNLHVLISRRPHRLPFVRREPRPRQHPREQRRLLRVRHLSKPQGLQDRVAAQREFEEKI